MEKSIHGRAYRRFLTLLRTVREEAELTQVDLAKAIGKTQSFVSKVERGETRLDVIQLRIVLGASGISLTKFAARLERLLDQK